MKKQEKNKPGRPLKFKTPEELQEKIEAYFDLCDQGKNIQKVSGGEVITIKQSIPYTISGLAVALKTNRQTLLEYEGEVEGRDRDPLFADTIKEAKQKIQSDYEQRALMGESNPTFSIFSMKNNFKWKDQSHVESNNTHEVAQVNFEFKEADHGNIDENGEEIEKK